MHFSTSILAAVPFFVSVASAAPSQRGGVSVSNVGTRKQCTVTANGGNVSDVSNILHAFSVCGTGGNIVFPEDQNYYIASKLNPVVNDVRIDWRGIWTVRQSFYIERESMY